MMTFGAWIRSAVVILALAVPPSANAASTADPNAGLMSAIVSWLSSNFGLPPSFEHPQIELASPDKIAALRYRGFGPDRVPEGAARPDEAAPAGLGRNPVAVYDDARRMIYLPQGWSAGVPADLSVLVHEMVHHLQNVAGLKYECPQAREKPAYAAQRRWLELFGRDLTEEFEINPMAILVLTNCM